MTVVETSAAAPSLVVRPPGTFSFLVPAYDEAAVLTDTVTRIAERLRREPGSEVVIIENGSTDDTWQVAQELASRNWGDVSVRALRSEKGLAEAYRAGAARASGQHLVFTAADLPFGFSDIDAFLALAEEERPRFAIGSKAHRRSVIQRTLDRRLMSAGFRVLRWGWLGPTAADPQGSLIFDAEMAERLVPETQGAGFIFGTELAALALAEGVRPVELPVRLVDERRSSTVRPVQDSVRMLQALVALRRRLDARADDRGRRQLAAGTGPGPVLARLVGQPHGAGGAAVAALSGVAGLALCLAAVLTVAAALRRFVLEDASGTPSAGSLVLTAGVVVAVLALAMALVGRMIGRRPRHAGPDDDPPGVGNRPDRRAVALASAAAALGAVVLALWRVLPSVEDRAVGSGDARYWYWLGWRLAEQVRSGDLFPASIDSVVWPFGYSVRGADGFLPAVVGTVWNLLLADPTLAFNAATATAVATTALAGVRLARGLGAGPALAGIAGLALSVAPALFLRVEGHYNLLFAFPAVLLVDLGLRHVLRRTQPLPVLRVAALLVLAYLSSGYYLVYGGLALGVVILAGSAGARRLLDSGVRLGLATVLAVVALTPFLVPKMQLEQREAELGAVPQSVDGESYASDATSFVTPPDGTWLAQGPVARYNDRFGGNVLEATAYPGALAVLGLGALVLFRSPVRRPLLAAAAVLWLLGLGTTLTVAGTRLPPGLRWLPTTVLLELPGFAGVRTPNRSSFVLAPVAVAAAVVVLLWVQRRSGRGLQGAVLAVALFAVLASVRIPTSWQAEPAGPLEQALVQVRELPEPGAVLHLPDDCIDTVHLVEYQVLHQRPLVGCQGFTSAVPWRAQLGPYAAASSWAALRCEPSRLGVLPAAAPADLPPTADAARALRRELGVGVVIFSTANRCPHRSDAILAALTEAGRVVGGDDTTVVVELPPRGEGA